MAMGRRDEEDLAAGRAVLTFFPCGPVGIELVDPAKVRAKVDEANAKWFNDGAFRSVRFPLAVQAAPY